MQYSYCPDCGFEGETGYRISCPKCRSLNLEKRIDFGKWRGQYIKSDAGIGEFNRKLIHWRLRK